VRNSGTPASLWLAIKIEQRLGNQSGAMRYARQLRENFPNSREMQLYDRGAWNN
jgi:type IV pilus assembly protein PilF